MRENTDSIDLYNRMTALGDYYSSGRSVKVDPAVIMEDILSKVPVKKSDVILDAGCGTGVITFPLARLCKFVHAIDAGESVIAAAKERCIKEGIDNVEHKVGSVLALPFEDNFFNHVILYGVIHCMDSDDQIKACVQEVVRVCKPGGRILIAEIPDRTARQELEQREKTAEEKEILEKFKINRQEYDKLFAERIKTASSAAPKRDFFLDTSAILRMGQECGCDGDVLKQDIRQPLSLTRRDVLLVKK